MAQPIIRWAGSKRQLVPSLRELMPSKYEVYIEPFFGSGCLYFSIEPQKARISDVNNELITVYKAIKKSPQKVAEYLHSIPHTEASYYKLRAIKSATLDEYAVAARFIFLMKSCFNGVYRTNMSGQFNTPFSGVVNKLPELQELKKISLILKKANIKNCDFEKTINSAISGDFIYADPPYPSKTFRGEYGYKRFDINDWKRLVIACEKASSRGVYIMISFCESDWLNNCLLQWNRKTVSARRTVSPNPANRKMTNEVVIFNF